MQLTFQQTHLSITSFPTTTIPTFTVITGPNGAGKTHLLQALVNGSIRTDVASPNTPAQEIRLFDWNTLVPQDAGAMTSETLRNERQNLEQQFLSLRQHPNAGEQFRNVARNRGLPQKFIDDPYLMTSLSKAKLEKLLPNPSDAEAVLAEIGQATTNASQFILGNVDQNAQAALYALGGAHQVPIAALTPKQVASSAFANWGRTDLFQQSFARLFVAYRDADLSNRLAEFNLDKGYSTEPFLSQEEFRKQYGPPPWDFVNNTIQTAGLDFSISEPSRNEFAPYTPQLTKNSTGAKIAFSGLSSGEKVLMSFAFCVYYANDRRQLSMYPKVLLFDEIDAPLHPSMTRSLINTITDTLVGDFGIHVIAATHSPSTIALAPDSAIHVMRPGKPGLHQTRKSEALNILTVGVPTIAISYDGRRQVFVESPADARTYDGLYKILKPALASERSLEFIATGTRSPTGQETNTGCDVVKRLVDQLGAAGNQSVFGLVDFDGRHTAAGRIAVLGGGSRNGIENYLLDPLLLACLICRDFKKERAVMGVEETLAYPAFLQAEADELQRCVREIANHVFGGPAATTVEAVYCGGLILKIDERWFTTDDHKLEALVLTAFPFLQSVTKQQAGRLMQHVIATVLNDEPGFIPKDVQLTFKDLLERPSHQ